MQDAAPKLKDTAARKAAKKERQKSQKEKELESAKKLQLEQSKKKPSPMTAVSLQALAVSMSSLHVEPPSPALQPAARSTKALAAIPLSAPQAKKVERKFIPADPADILPIILSYLIPKGNRLRVIAGKKNSVPKPHQAISFLLSEDNTFFDRAKTTVISRIFQNALALLKSPEEVVSLTVLKVQSIAKKYMKPLEREFHDLFHDSLSPQNPLLLDLYDLNVVGGNDDDLLWAHRIIQHYPNTRALLLPQKSTLNVPLATILTKFKQLNALITNRAQAATDQALRKLQSLSLGTLTLVAPKITGKGLACLNSERFWQLDIKDCTLDVTDFQVIAKHFTKLETLYITTSLLDDAALCAIAQIQKLKDLRFTYTPVLTVNGFQALARVQTLTTLKITDLPKAVEEVVRKMLLKNCTLTV